jgi:hypothetical protein
MFFGTGRMQAVSDKQVKKFQGMWSAPVPGAAIFFAEAGKVRSEADSPKLLSPKTSGLQFYLEIVLAQEAKIVTFTSPF